MNRKETAMTTEVVLITKVTMVTTTTAIMAVVTAIVTTELTKVLWVNLELNHAIMVSCDARVLIHWAKVRLATVICMASTMVTTLDNNAMLTLIMDNWEAVTVALVRRDAKKLK